MEELVKSLDVRPNDLRILGNFFIFREKEAEHATHMIGGKGNSRLVRDMLYPLAQFFGVTEQIIIEVGLRDNIKRCEARGHGLWPRNA